MVTFRVADANDRAVIVEMLAALVDELGPPEMAERVKPRLDDDIGLALASPRVHVVLAVAGDLAVGLGRADVLTTDPIFRLRDDHRCGYIDQMYVRPNYRSTGIGRELLARCEAWFREQGIEHCLLHAAPRAMRFYAREGYQPNREMFKRL
jgi:GNAT superfamily N-acetyltransferase